MRLAERVRSSRRSSSDSVGRTLLNALGWLLLVPTAGGVISYFVTPGSSTTLAPSAVAFILLALAVPALLVFAVGRQWWGALIAAAITVLLVVLVTPLYVAASAPANARDLTVMTSNVRLGLADAEDVVHEVRAHHVDVLMVQELTPQMRARLHTAGLDETLPHAVDEPADGAAGTGLWSRYPLTRVETGRLTFRSVAARVTIPGVATRPTLMALHVAGPVPDATDWGKDMDVLPARLRALPGTAPVLVGGDFNATYSVNRFRHLLAGGYADAGEQAGAGLQRTYPSDRFFPPVMGIDHVLTRGGAVARSARTLQISGSDHRALLVTVAVPRTS